MERVDRIARPIPGFGAGVEGLGRGSVAAPRTMRLMRCDYHYQYIYKYNNNNNNNYCYSVRTPVSLSLVLHSFHFVSSQLVSFHSDLTILFPFRCSLVSLTSMPTRFNGIQALLTI